MTKIDLSKHFRFLQVWIGIYLLCKQSSFQKERVLTQLRDLIHASKGERTVQFTDQKLIDTYLITGVL